MLRGIEMKSCADPPSACLTSTRIPRARRAGDLRVSESWSPARERSLCARRSAPRGWPATDGAAGVATMADRSKGTTDSGPIQFATVLERLILANSSNGSHIAPGIRRWRLSLGADEATRSNHSGVGKPLVQNLMRCCEGPSSVVRPVRGGVRCARPGKEWCGWRCAERVRPCAVAR